MDLPKIISVDDHVAEPAHVWQTWLPERYREKGPHVERKRWGKFEHKAGAKYVNPEDPEGRWGDAWYFEDRLIYVHKRFVAIPLEATPGGESDKVTVRFFVMYRSAVTVTTRRSPCDLASSKCTRCPIWTRSKAPWHCTIFLSRNRSRIRGSSSNATILSCWRTRVAVVAPIMCGTELPTGSAPRSERRRGTSSPCRVREMMDEIAAPRVLVTGIFTKTERRLSAGVSASSAQVRAEIGRAHV